MRGFVTHQGYRAKMAEPRSTDNLPAGTARQNDHGGNCERVASRALMRICCKCNGYLPARWGWPFGRNDEPTAHHGIPVCNARRGGEGGRPLGAYGLPVA